MHKYKNIAKGVLLFILVVFLYAFSSKRNTDLPIAKTNIEFVGEDHLLISKNIVDKLLIQNQQAVECMPKDILDLNELESKISSHPMIEKAEVYLTVNGEVRVEVAQRKPLARVISEPSFYIDSRGEMMPLSPEHSARVILVYGNVDASNLQAINELLQYITQDEFLKLYVTEIIVNEEQQFSLAIRTYDFEVAVGTTKDLDKKSIDKEMEIIKAELLNSGKQPEIAEKISKGKINKFISDNTLLNQIWIMDSKKKVSDILKENDIKIVSFIRYKVGEGV